MCYSAMVEAYLKHLEFLGALDREGMAELMRIRQSKPGVRLPFALERSFDNPATDQDREIKALIDVFRSKQETAWQQELFKQRARVIAADRILATKPTKKAAEDKRIGTAKVEELTQRLQNLRRTEPKPDDGRIFPFWYAPVLVMREGRHVITPMRYHLRQAGKPADYDFKFPGLYNARRDNLKKFWRNQFGQKHAVLVVTSFFENVAKHVAEHRELAPGEEPRNLVLHFNPQPPQPMYLACLWDAWTGPDETLHSFAAITDEPPAEVAAAGHDRCVIPIAEKNIDAWLTPEGRSDEELLGILDERARPFYEHRLAA